MKMRWPLRLPHNHAHQVKMPANAASGTGMLARRLLLTGADTKLAPLNKAAAPATPRHDEKRGKQAC